jgi:hypothetical protein
MVLASFSSTAILIWIIIYSCALYLIDSISLILQGGNTFMVRSDKPVPNGTYDVKIGKYGSCEASGSGNEFLFGLESIPPGTS